MIAPAQRGGCAVLDLGAESSNLTLFRGAAIAFSRTLSFGGNQITKLLQAELGLEWQEAESFKTQQVVVGKSRNDADSLSTMITLTMQELIREVRRSLEYFQIQHRDEIIEQIYFTGGGSLLSGLREYLAAELGMQIGNVELTHKFMLPPSFDAGYVKGIAPVYMMAFGLALWEENR
jgi:type IV pilus assembly protein PilM